MRKANILTLNPAVLLYVTNALVAMATAWGLSLTATQQGAVDTIVTGVLALAVALAARPVIVPAVQRGTTAEALQLQPASAPVQ